MYKRVKTLKDGGYYHVYKVVEETKTQKIQANLRVQEITTSLQKLVDNFITDFHRHLKAIPECSLGNCLTKNRFSILAWLNLASKIKVID